MLRPPVQDGRDHAHDQQQDEEGDLHPAVEAAEAADGRVDGRLEVAEVGAGRVASGHRAVAYGAGPRGEGRAPSGLVGRQGRGYAPAHAPANPPRCRDRLGRLHRRLRGLLLRRRPPVARRAGPHPAELRQLEAATARNAADVQSLGRVVNANAVFAEGTAREVKALAGKGAAGPDPSSRPR